MKMSILRAVRAKGLDVDVVHNTVVANVERDSDEFVTIYGTERKGQLYYIVLDQDVVDRIRSV